MGSASSNSDAWSAVSIAPSIPMRPSSPGRDTTKWTRPQEMDGPNSTMMAPSTVRSAFTSCHLRHPHHALPSVLACEQADQCFGRILESLDHVLLDFELPRLHPALQ